MRLTLLVLLGLVVIGTGAALAATRTETQLIGTGVVVVDTKLGYETGEAAGTGMVLTSSGEVLTNNHVIDGATSITVVVPGTDTPLYGTGRRLRRERRRRGPQARQRVEPEDDLGRVGNGEGRRRGDRRRQRGWDRQADLGERNGDGPQQDDHRERRQRGERAAERADRDERERPGRRLRWPTRERGRTGRRDGYRRLHGGGPYASYSGTDAYAIPTGKALAIAKAIQDGKASATIHVGATAFLGVEVATDGDGSGALVEGVVSGGPAASAGIGAGDVITSIGGRQVSSTSDVQSIVLTEKAGKKVSVTFTDQTGATQTTTVTLGSGPAQ